MRHAAMALLGARKSADGPDVPFEALEPRLALSAPTAAPLAPTVWSEYIDLPILYQSDTPLDMSTIDDHDLAVTGPNGYAQWGHRGPIDDRGSAGVVVHYSVIPIPGPSGGHWDLQNANGTYNVGIAQDAVRNTAGEGNAGAGVGSYWFWFTPQLEVGGQNLTGEGPQAEFTQNPLVYTPIRDEWRIAISETTTYPIYASTLVVRVTGPNGFASSTFATQTPPYRGLAYETTTNYVSTSVFAPGGAWDFGDNGDYVVQVGFAAPGSWPDHPVLGEVALTRIFTQNIDTPRAEVVSSAFGARDWIAAVRYSAAPGATVNIGSISDLDVEGYFAMTPLHELAATLMRPPTANSDGSVTAVYRIQSPSLDGWASTYSGPGQLWTRAGEITDTANRSVGVGPIAAETPSLDRPSVFDLRTLSAVVNAWNVELTMQGAGAMAGTLTPGGGNLSVYADINGVFQQAPLNVQFVSFSTGDNDTLNVRYRIVPQQGYFWDGTFTIIMNPQNMFSVDWGIGFSQAFVMHFAGPSVQGLRTVSRTNTSWDVELAFDNPGSLISTSSLSAQNLIVAAPGGRTMRIALVSFANGPDHVLRARYRITSVNSGTSLARGTYGFSLRGNSVMAAGVGLPGQFITTMTI